MTSKITYYQKFLDLYEKRNNPNDAPKILWYKKKIAQEETKDGRQCKSSTTS